MRGRLEYDSLGWVEVEVEKLRMGCDRLRVLVGCISMSLTRVMRVRVVLMVN
jgi:hypothetical protein